MSKDYTLHKVWEPVISKIDKENPASVRYQIGQHFYGVALCAPEPHNPAYSLAIFMLDDPVEHKAKITVKLNGKTPREFTEMVVFKKQANHVIFDNFLPASMVSQYTYKDRVTIEITAVHSEAREVIPDYRATTGYVGLKNQAATCYMNSILQLLYHIPAFRRLIYSAPEEESGMVLSLQRLFCMLQLSSTTVSTDDLTKSFGWSSQDAFYQHDVQEFIRVLIDKIEEKLKSSSLDDQLTALLRGTTTQYLKCINADYESSSTVNFYDVSLVVKGKKTIEESLAAFVEDELMSGDNGYKIDGKGEPQNAIKGCKFDKLPPVLHFHLTRFEYSATSFSGMEKVKDRFEFPTVLDMSMYCEDTRQDAIYELFSVLVHIGNNMAGHYIAYCRPTTAEKWYRFNDAHIEKVDVETVTEYNYGSKEQGHHAYYLCYIRRSDIPWVMEQIPVNEIPRHLRDYFEKKRDAADPTMMTVSFVNHPEIEKMRVPKTMRVSALMERVKKEYPAVKSLWSASLDEGPMEYLAPKDILQSKLTVPGRIFIADFSVLSSMTSPCAFDIKFFFPKKPEPLQNFGFKVVDKKITLNPLFRIVSELAKFPANTKFDIFREYNGKITQIPATNNQPLLNLKPCCGKLIFQLAAESAGASSTFVFPEVEKSEKLMRARDMIAAIQLDTAERFLNHTKRCIRVNVHDMNNTLSTIIEIPDVMQLRILIRCIRTALNIGDEDGIALYLPDAKDPSKHIEELINSHGTANLSKALKMHGRTKNVKLFAKIVKGLTQDQTNTMIPLSFPLLDEMLDQLAVVHMEIPADANVGCVLKEARKYASIDDDRKLRMLLLSKSCIVQTLNEDFPMSKVKDYELRVEVVPPSDEELEEGEFLLRCSMSHNYKYPPNGTILTPMMLKVNKGETFDLTKCRIASILPADFGEPDFILYRGKRHTTRFVPLTEETDELIALSEVATEPDAMLFIMIQPATVRKMYQKMFNPSLKICD